MCHAASVKVAIFCIVAATGAYAQVTTDRLSVGLSTTRAECGKIEDVVVVINDEDASNRSSLDRDKENPCHWRGNARSTFSEDSHFSLRLGIARTECHQAFYYREKRDVKDRYDYVARLDFDCCNSEKVAEVSFHTDRRMPVTYRREVKLRVPNHARHELSTSCTEYGVFDEGAGKVKEVQFTGERIRLQLGVDSPDDGALGLIVDPRLDAQKGLVVPLTPDAILRRLIEQRAKGTDGSAPNLSPNATEVDRVKLQRLQLKKFEVTVK